MQVQSQDVCQYVQAYKYKYALILNLMTIHFIKDHGHGPCGPWCGPRGLVYILLLFRSILYIRLLLFLHFTLKSVRLFKKIIF